jgi:hypothetical protein
MAAFMGSEPRFESLDSNGYPQDSATRDDQAQDPEHQQIKGIPEAVV